MWVRLDDRFPNHPKVITLTNLAFRTHVEAMCYCGQYTTGGWITSAAVSARRAAVDELVAAGLWAPSGDGYQLHDWADYNPTREQIEQRRKAARARQQRHRSRNADDDGDVTP
jgi:hypothetical protein